MRHFAHLHDLQALVGQEIGVSDWIAVDAEAHRPVRRGHRRPPVDPRRPGARRQRALRHDHRARLPDAEPAAGDVRHGLRHRRRAHGRQLRAEPGALHRRRCPAAAGCAGTSCCKSYEPHRRRRAADGGGARSSAKARPSRSAWPRRCRAASSEPASSCTTMPVCKGAGTHDEGAAGRRPSADPVGAADGDPGPGRRRVGARRRQRRRGARGAAEAMPTSTWCCSTCRWATPTASTC